MVQTKIGAYERSVVTAWCTTQLEDEVANLKEALGVVKYDYVIRDYDGYCMKVMFPNNPHMKKEYDPIPAEYAIFNAYLHIRSKRF